MHPGSEGKSVILPLYETALAESSTIWVVLSYFFGAKGFA